MKKQILSISLLVALMVTGCKRGGSSEVVESSSATETSSSLVEGSTTTTNVPSSTSSTQTSTSSANNSSSANTQSSQSTSTGGNTSVKPPIILGNSFEEALKKSYTNMTASFALNSVEVGQEYGYEYYTGNHDFVAVLDGTTAETYGSDYAWSFYSYYEGESYSYWKGASYVTEGWVSKGSKGRKVGIDYAYFYMPYFLSNINKDDVDNVLGAYVVKAESMDKVMEGLKFTYMTNNITYIDIFVNSDGYISKIRGFDDPNSDELGFVVELAKFGQTSVPTSINVPPEIGPTTIKTYVEMIGHEEIPDIYMTDLSIVINEPVESDDTYQIIMYPDDAIDLSFNYLPANANKREVSWHSTNEEVAELLYGQQSGHQYLRAIKEGETEIYVDHINEYHETISSRRLKVKVQAPKQVEESAQDVYRFTFTGTTGTDGHNTIGAVNTITGSEAPYAIKAWRMKTMNGNYSDNFQADDVVLYSAPNSATNYNERFEDEVLFDFESQQVNKISFLYALFRCNSKNSLNLLEKVTLSTSNDGDSWIDYDMTEEFRTEFNKASLSTGMTPKVFSKVFLPASMVKIVISATNVGGNDLGIGMKDFVFSADENCHNYNDVDAVPVTSIVISAPRDRLKINSSMKFSAAILPEDASNKNVRWVSDNTDVLTIDARTGLATAVATGTAKVKAISTTNNAMVSNELTITVYEQEEIYDPNNMLIGKKFYAEGVTSGANTFDVTFDIKDNKNATLVLAFAIPGVGTFQTSANVVFDSFDALTGRYVFLSDNNDEVSFFLAEDGSYIELTYKKGNDYTLGTASQGVVLNKVR